MEKCESCKKEATSGSITGRLEKTDKTLTLCWPCFEAGYELVPGQKENVFRKKKEA